MCSTLLGVEWKLIRRDVKQARDIFVCSETERASNFIRVQSLDFLLSEALPRGFNFIRAARVTKYSEINVASCNYIPNDFSLGCKKKSKD